MEQRPISLSSPSPNVAQKTVVAIANASTRIKETVLNALKTNEQQDELTRKLNKIIADTCSQFKSETLREDIRKSLVVSSRKWHYELSKTFEILNSNFINKAQQLNLLSPTYSYGITSGVLIDKFRPYLDSNTKGIPLIEEYDRHVKTAIKALSADPPKVVKVTKKNGVTYTYTMSARNRAEIAARYEANMKDLRELIARGVEYAWTTSHPNASHRCSPHQGKLYSLNPNNPRGTIDGNPYTYLGDVLSENEGNSIINGYNCRHRLIEYQKGSHAPNEYTEAEIKKEYAIDTRQRNYENKIRQLKTEERLARINGDLKYAKELRLEWRRLTLDYEIYSLEHGRPFYLWRTRISNAERDYVNENKNVEIVENIVDISNESDIQLYRKANEGVFAELEVPMRMRNVKGIAKKHGIDIERLSIEIDRDEDKMRLMYTGSTSENGDIKLFPKAFKNKEELLRTLIHEKVHVEQYKKYGTNYVLENYVEMDEEAYRIENESIKKILGN